MGNTIGTFKTVQFSQKSVNKAAFELKIAVIGLLATEIVKRNWMCQWPFY